jgi:SAM-dependent methyltransferase
MTTQGTGEDPLYLDRRRADSFGEIAELYDTARPTYPDGVIDALLADEPMLVLDVGCGTGIASRLLAGRGCDVLGLEPDPRMAAVARRHGLAVEEGSFETWDADGRRFDLLTAGQAWHWVEPAAGARKAAEVLRPGGRIGLFWNQSFPSADLRPALDAVYQRLAPQIAANSVLLGDRHTRLYEAIARSLRQSGRFTDVDLLTFAHEVDYATAEWLDLASTHSDHLILPAEQNAELVGALGAVLDAAGGRLAVRYETTLVTGRTPPG